MPGLDGLELIRLLRRERPDLKVIAMSGGGFGGAIDLLSVAQRLGAVEIVRKPFTRDTVLAAVARALDPPAERATIWVRNGARWYLPGDPSAGSATRRTASSPTRTALTRSRVASTTPLGPPATG